MEQTSAQSHCGRALAAEARRSPDRSMRSRRLTPTTILDDTEVRAVAAAVKVQFGEWFRFLGRSPDLETIVRLGSLSKRCMGRREEMGATIAEVARAIRAPQYRVKAIERGSLGEIEARALRAYIAHLGIGAWYRRWKKANPELATRLERGEAGEQRLAPDGSALARWSRRRR